MGPMSAGGMGPMSAGGMGPMSAGGMGPMSEGRPLSFAGALATAAPWTWSRAASSLLHELSPA
jgi:hypothetical protein